MADAPKLPPLPTHPFRIPLASWEPSEVLAIQAYAAAYGAECRRLALEQMALACEAKAAERERWLAAAALAADALRELERYEYATATLVLRKAVATFRA